MNRISIKIATSSDATAIRQVQHDVWMETYPNKKLGITVETIKERVSKYITPELIKSLQESLTRSNQHTWIAKEDSKVIGYCTAVKNDSANQLEAIYLLSAYHGREVGKKLIEACLEWLGSNKDILVEVAAYNDRAIHFYEKHGFKKNEVKGHSGEIPTIKLVRQSSS